LARPARSRREALCRDHFSNGQAAAAHRTLFSPQRRVGGDRAGLRQPEDHRVAGLCPQQIGHLAIEHDFSVPGQLHRPAGAELPESLVAADQVDLVGPAWRVAGRVLQAGSHEDRRHGPREVLTKAGLCGQLAGQVLAEEAVGRQREVDPAQAFEGQAPQALSHRVAHQQRPGEHRRARRHPQGHGEVHSPVVGERAQREAEESHGGRMKDE